MTNYTISSFSATENVGDSIFHNNMITSGTVVITPNSRYVVSASDFSIPNLPTGIASVVFTDNTTAGQPGNTVTVTFTFASSFSVTSNFNIGLGIQGDAKLYDPSIQTVSYTIKLIDDTNVNLNGSSSLKDSSGSVITGSTSGGVITYPISGNVTTSVLTKIAELTITNDTNYYFKNKTYLKYINLSSSELKLKQTSVTRDSNKRMTSIVYDVMLSISSSIKSPAKAIINYNAITTPTTTKEIARVEYGYFQASNLGENRTIRVYGDIGAEFNIAVIKDSDKSSILDTNIANTDILDITAGGSIKAFSKKITGIGPKTKGISYCDFKQIIPSGTDKYYINIYPINNSTLNSKMPTTYPNYTIEQYANPTLTITSAEGTGTGYTVTTAGRVDHIGRPNAYAYELAGTGVTESISLTIVATRSSSNTFKTVTNPAWSSSDATASHWDNSVPADNGGMHIEMYDLKTVYGDAGAGANTIATITATVRIKKWGNATTVMTLDTGKFLTCNAL